MRKIFALFLAFTLLCLTACNTNPPVDTNMSGEMTSGTSNVKPGGSLLQDQIVERGANKLIELSSRIVFQASKNFYYSKADGKAYVYCFDPICDHTDYTCLANPGSFLDGFSFINTAFVNDRFYCMTQYGKIYSFAFDGSDKKLEYDAGYNADMFVSKSIWRTMIAYGPYLYIDSKEYETPHALRFNVETKEMEDLTEKTGNYIYPHFFYNGLIYGQGDNSVMLDAFYKADLALQSVEHIEDISVEQHAGSVLIGYVYAERESIEDQPEKIGISFVDMKTGERRVVTKEDLGLDYYPTFVAATEEYFYFYKSELINLGDGVDKSIKAQKRNDGKLYRMNKDGTNIVCVYDNPDYELNGNALIYDDKIVMQGQYVAIENGEKKIWGGAIQVATIHPDGTIGEFREVEILQ